MQQITLLTIEDIRQAVKDELKEHYPQPTSAEPETYIHGLKGLAEFLNVGITKAWQLSKKLPRHGTGKKLFFLKSEVLAATKIKG
jgi:hypothetical protein